MGSYGFKVIGRVPMEDERVGRVPIQNCSWRLGTCHFMCANGSYVVAKWSNGRPIYQMKAENEIFRLVYPIHTYSYVVLH